MRLELQNFRCWKGNVFDFPEDGLVLLDGPSGIGKSSLFIAIQFALYGSGAKTTTFGCNKSSVRFVYQALDVVRTRTPNTLNVTIDKVEYTGDTAQEIINSKFGKNFNMTSYITQKFISTFLTMSNADKMTFLENVLLQDDDIDQIKLRTKQEIREAKNELISKVSQLELLKIELASRDKPVHIEFPLDGKYHETKIKNESIRWKKNTLLLTKLRKELGIHEELKNKQNIQKALYSKHAKTLQELQEELNIKETEKSNMEFDAEDFKLLKIAINKKKSSRELNTLKNKQKDMQETIESLKQNQHEEWNSLIDSYRSQQLQLILVDKDQLENYVREIDEINTNHQNIKQYNSLENEIVNLKSKLVEDFDTGDALKKESDLEDKLTLINQEKVDLLKRKDVLCCPNCQQSLRLLNGGLKKVEESPVDSSTNSIIESLVLQEKKIISERLSLRQAISTHTKFQAVLQEKLSTLSAISIDKSLLTDASNIKLRLKNATDVNSNYHALAKKISDIEIQITNKSYSKTVTNKINELTLLKKQIDKVFASLDIQSETGYEDNSEEDLQQEYSEQLILQEKNANIIKTIQTIKTKISSNKAESSLIKILDADYDSLITECKQRITLGVQKDEIHKQNSEKINLYILNKLEVDLYNQLLVKIADLQTQERIAQQNLGTCETFYSKIQQTESILVGQMITTINYHTNEFLEKFFHHLLKHLF